MRQRLGVLVLLGAAAIGLSAQPAAAQQTLNFTLGYFAVRGEDARVEGDILNEHLGAEAPFVYDLQDFNSASIGGEWLVPLSRYLEAGAGVSFTRRTVPSVYEDFIDADGSEIEQDIRLRRVPVDLTMRVVPLGQQSSVQPYFGAGISIVSWRYSESGEFVDFTRGNAIFRDQFVASGSETGPVVLGGVRFAGENLSAGAEVRYYSAEGELGNSTFASPAPVSKIDLGGWTYQFNIGMRFGL